MLDSEITKKFGQDKAQLQHAIVDIVDDSVNMGKERIDNITGSVQDAYNNTLEKTRDKASEIQNKAQDTLSRALQFYQTQPLLMAGAFIAAGALIAAVMIRNATSSQRPNAN